MNRRNLFLVATAALLCVGIYSSFHWRRLGHGGRHRAERTSASNQPAHLGLSGIAADADGNIYVSARNLNQVLEVSADRQARVAAGSGSAGFAGDGASALTANLAQPMGIALDSDRNLFIADTANNRIRRVDAKTGKITTVAGNGKMGGGTGGQATSSGIYEPVSVAVDRDGNLYIGGTTSIGIRRVDAISGIVSKALGADLPGTPLSAEPATGPYWVAIGMGGGVFFSDPSRNTVSWLDASTGETHPVAGSAQCGFSGDDSSTTGSLLCFPEGLALSNDKQLYIADTGNNRIRRVDLETGVVTTVAGNGQADDSGDRGKAIQASLNGPMAVAVDGKGNLYIADTGNDCIRRVDADSGIITTWITGRDLRSAAR